MTLQYLGVAVSRSDPIRAVSMLDADLAQEPCSFCAGRSRRWQFAAWVEGAARAACVLCHLAQHLDRPRIDEEALLVWLPEISQPMLNILMRHVHVGRRRLGESVVYGTPPRSVTLGLSPLEHRAAIHHVLTAVAARAEEAEQRLGTRLPSELACVLAEFDGAMREQLPHLLSGLRVLPLGRFYVGQTDAYPDIVDDWITLANVSPVPAAPLPRPRLQPVLHEGA